MNNNTKYSKMKILPRVPALFPDEDDQSFPSSIIDSKILAIGTTKKVDLEEHGLIIDYVPSGDSTIHRMVIGFTDLGMCVNKLVKIGSVPTVS